GLWDEIHQELGVRSEELGIRSEELGVSSEELGVRSEELGDKFQISNFKSQIKRVFAPRLTMQPDAEETIGTHRILHYYNNRKS
ncbi:MAG: hypothetical protein IKN22_04655, partial [Bacteroidaceae bacterium]|nr:hypothetical protein [Bacteroidaceae bacterium]